MSKYYKTFGFPAVAGGGGGGTQAAGWEPTYIIVGGGNTLLDPLDNPIGDGIICSTEAVPISATVGLDPGSRGTGSVTISSGAIAGATISSSGGG